MGRICYRQYVRNKSRPIGLKNFVITSSKGLVLDFEIYQEKNTLFGDRSLGLDSAVALRLAKRISDNSVLFFDSYFTTVLLQDRLNKMNIKVIGIIKNNHLKNTHFSEDKV